MKRCCRLNPLESYEIGPKASYAQEGSVVWRDDKLLHSPAHAKKVSAIFEGSPFRWRIFATMGEDKQVPKSTPGVITYVLRGSTGDPLTPWMIAHRVGHALKNSRLDGWGIDTELFEQSRRFLERFVNELDRVREAGYVDLESVERYEKRHTEDWEYRIQQIASLDDRSAQRWAWPTPLWWFLTMRSARRGRELLARDPSKLATQRGVGVLVVDTWEEASYECVAQYLVRGEVELRDPFGKHDKRASDEMNEIIKAALEHEVGEVIGDG